MYSDIYLEVGACFGFSNGEWCWCKNMKFVGKMRNKTNHPLYYICIGDARIFVKLARFLAPFEKIPYFCWKVMALPVHLDRLGNKYLGITVSMPKDKPSAWYFFLSLSNLNNPKTQLVTKAS